MQGEGQRLKNAIRGRDETIEDAAIRMGMSRQSFAYHLQKAKLDVEIKQKAKEILGIDVDLIGAIIEAKEPPAGYGRQGLSKQKPTFDELIYFMGQILKLPLSQLQSALQSEPDQDRRKVIHEVIQTKEKIQLLEDRLKDKESIIESKRIFQKSATTTTQVKKII